jgi:transposase
MIIITQQDSFKITMEGFSYLLAFFNINKESTFVMELTGCYHLLLYHFLLNQSRTAYIINPSFIKQYKNANTLRKTKTDPLDAHLISQYANRLDVQLEGMRSSLETKSKILFRSRVAKTKTRLKSNLSLSFPEMFNFNVYIDSMLNFLSVYGCYD